MNQPNRQVRKWAVQLAGLTLAAASLLGSKALLAQVNIATAPLFLTSSVDPNIMFILDDSGSMHWEITPDEVMIATYTFPRAAGNYGAGGDYLNRVPSPRSETTQSTSANERATAAVMRSAHVNATYYNPAITYRPWVKPAGMAITAVPPVATEADRFPNASPTAAPNHPIRNTGTRNLTVDTTEAAEWVFGSGINPVPSLFWATGGSGSHNQTYFPATYFQYIGGPVFNRDSYQRVEIRSTTPFYIGHGRENRTDCADRANARCTYAEEIQNFANWYTYYRSRILASQAGIGEAFINQSERMRVGFGTINQGSNSVDGVNTTTIRRGVRPFTGADRQAFFTQLYLSEIPTAGTPLRRALDAAGQYFSRSDNLGPWGRVPGTNDPSAHLTCRQSFTILMTDGYWNGAEAGTSAARANIDGVAWPAITGPSLTPGGPLQSFTYNPRSPFSDSRANTLADIGMFYWVRDLRPDLPNRVPATAFNPAFWQHMVTYGVGLGVTGSINPATAFSAVTDTSIPAINWPDPLPDTVSAPKLDDLLHAAVNSRGGFFSASDPVTFANELGGILSDIVSRVETSGTAAATSSAVLQTDTLLYTASFRSTDWSGTLVAREIDPVTGSASTIQWDAERKMGSTTVLPTRNIFTRNADGTPVTLSWANLSPTQQTALGVNPTGVPATAATGQDRLNWLRGQENAGLRSRFFQGVDESTGSSFTLIRRIGSLINSDPQFMARRDFGNSLLPGVQGSTYQSFRSSTAYRERPDVLFVGSNTGMLHAFHAGTPYINKTLTNPKGEVNPLGGTELFAFVPSELLLPKAGTSQSHAQINELMVPDFNHRYFVDGTPTVADVYWTDPENAANSGWRSVLVGSMGAGGRTVFALDVTDPTNFNASKVLWEFRYADQNCTVGVTACREVGYGITQPTIARLRSTGQWVAIFGNGYNSASHTAKLFVVDIRTGQLVHMIDTGVGTAAIPNGLAPPVSIDWPNRDLSLSRIYAGDLRGNLWRFDFTSATPTAQRLFTATSSDNSLQPITARPSIAQYPGNDNRIVITFGTGSFFRAGDNAVGTQQTQTLYGIFDTAAGLVDTIRSQLLAQTISSNNASVTLGTGTNQVTFAAGQLRAVSALPIDSNLNVHKGWRIDLPVNGERVISFSTFPSGSIQRRVRFTTLIPDNDPCGSGRSGFLLDVNLSNGGESSTDVFDLTRDGLFTAADRASIGGAVRIISGIAGTTGERLTVIRRADAAIDSMFAGDGINVGSGLNTAGPIGRKSWRQLR
jgi:type IV pilus assembly protein PilY1